MLKLVAAQAGTLLAIFMAACGTSPAERPAAAAQPSAMLAEFPVMETPPERVPPTVALALKRTVPGLSRLAAQEVPTPSRAVQVWALANAERICLISLEGRGGIGLTCQLVAVAMKDGIAITLIGRFDRGAVERAIIGIAPREGGAIVARAIGGSSVTIPVTDGVFARVDSQLRPPDRLTLVRRP